MLVDDSIKIEVRLSSVAGRDPLRRWLCGKTRRAAGKAARGPRIDFG
jgi:hypothetical protein